MSSSGLCTWTFLGALAAYLGVNLWLYERHLRHVRRHRDELPPIFAPHITPAEHRKAADYTMARVAFARVELLYAAAVLLGWTLGGGLDALDRAWRALALPALMNGVACLVSALLLTGLLGLPTALYRTFVIEQRHGFNRTTAATFVSDLLKQAVLLLFIGAPLAALVLLLMQQAGPFWWLWVWGLWLGFSVLMTWAYPLFIAPLFNRFQPLEDAALAARVRTLLARSGFESRGLFVMDGSRRSAHGNAYFTGFGRAKRIVFFDTLLEALGAEELEAVLAHELGHFRLHHLRSRLLAMAGSSLLGLAVLAGLARAPWFYLGLGVTQPSAHAALLLFLMTAPVFTFFLQPLAAWLSRRQEFQADAYAARLTDVGALVRALVKLYRDNASTLTPDPLYSAWKDSHPPAPRRIARLLALAPTGRQA